MMKTINQMKPKRIVALLLAGLSVLLLSACEEEKSSKIEWQLPLEAPEDLHGGIQDMMVPEWAAAAEGDAELVWLQKSTTKLFPVRIAQHATLKVEGWDIELLGLANGLRIQNNAFLNDENVDNPAAFVRISRDGTQVYSGWLYAKFPELFGLDDPEWKVWLKGVNVRAPSEEGSQNKLP